ncbi:hypothetical protein OH76DRAFT_548105 [Lentinus brumalis]|uniref:Uncharacterized protein n=1 Tax=Lentinus brumalis TaxID=2498619 RepID=A0A371D9V9_9APHY|nr:hypothetical protein OH76DRAFT_548105 [Polyporus brumalis]
MQLPSDVGEIVNGTNLATKMSGENMKLRIFRRIDYRSRTLVPVTMAPSPAFVARSKSSHSRPIVSSGRKSLQDPVPALSPHLHPRECTRQRCFPYQTTRTPSDDGILL